MDHYSDEEQIEALKKWWQANGKAIIAGVLIGLAIIFGWRYWTAYRHAHAVEASTRYDTLLQALDQDDAETIRSRGQQLLQEFPNSPYATLAALALAKLEVETGDSSAASERLQWVLNHAKQEEMKDIARLRLARVLVAENQLDAAEAQLDQISDPSFMAEVEDLRGDVYVARNQSGKARNAYQTALATIGSTGYGTMLQLKLDSLPPPTDQQ